MVVNGIGMAAIYVPQEAPSGCENTEKDSRHCAFDATEAIAHGSSTAAFAIKSNLHSVFTNMPESSVRRLHCVMHS
jgi:hypothetical protein